MADKVKQSDLGKVRVLVYGTLKSSGTNAALMDRIRAKFIGFDYVQGPFKLLDLGPFPAVFDQSDEEIKKSIGEDQKVYGEVYMMEEEALASLDFYEGHPNFFQRRKVWTEVEHKRVWMYILTVDGLNDPKQATSVDDGMWEAGEDEATFWNQDLTL